MTQKSLYRVALGTAIVATLILVWLALGVGIIGADGDRSNVMYAAVLAVGCLGALLARFRPRGMAWVLVAMACTQAAITVIALVRGLGAPASPPAELILLNGFFIAVFAGSALLFRHAARKPFAEPEPARHSR